MAIALGWAFAEITSLRLVKILTSEFQADEFRAETLINSFTSLFDLLRIVGVTFLVEKMSRKGRFTCGLHLIIIFAVALASEVVNIRLTDEQDKLSMARSKTLLGSINDQLTLEDYQGLVVTGLAYKITTALVSIGSNYIVSSKK